MTIPAPANGMALMAHLVGQAEGCELRPYLDTGGVPTIGYGCTRLNGVPVTMRTPAITQAQAEAALQFELAATQRLLSAVLTRVATAGQWAAMGSLSYNVGDGAFTKSSVLRQFNAGDIRGAQAHFADWDLVQGRVEPGLVHRRALEASVFEHGMLLTSASAQNPASPVHAAITRTIAVPARYDVADDLNAAELATLGG